MDLDLKKELNIFENFLNSIGFKRIDGAIYGLLVLSEKSLTSDEIEKALGLSQSAISLSLKTLNHFGAVESSYSSKRRANVHCAKEDGLSIVASVFKKREQENILEFKLMAKKALNRTTSDSIVAKRLKSIIDTSEIAESVMNFVIHMSQLPSNNYTNIIKKLPKALDFIIHGAEPLESLAQSFTSALTNRLKGRNDNNHSQPGSH